MEDSILNIDILKHYIEELSNLKKDKQTGYSCGWTDACMMILGLIEEEEQKYMATNKTRNNE